MDIADPIDWQSIVRLGVPVIYRESVDSTNLLARRLIPHDAPPGAVIIAEQQTAGRGRLGRSWIAAPGAALTCTVILGTLAPAWAASMVAGLGVLDAARALRVPASLKWPNDVLIGDKKGAGILIEAQQLGDELWLLAGIGINVHACDPGLPDATWLDAHAPHAISRTALLRDLLAALSQRSAQARTDPAALRAAWKAELSTLGQVVQVHTPAGSLTGLAVDVDVDGALLLRLPDGAVRAVHAGDVTLSSRVPDAW